MDILSLQRRVAFDRSEQAYRSLFLHFYPRIFRFATMYVEQREIAEELVSDVMIKLWTMEQRLAEIKNLNVYLYSATKNASINHLKKKKRYDYRDIDEVVPSAIQLDQTPESLLLNRELNEQIVSAIRKLPPKCQTVYCLIRWDGLTYHEVAKIMNISENTVDRHLNIAVHKLTTALNKYLKA